jgi:hypothetical protein
MLVGTSRGSLLKSGGPIAAMDRPSELYFTCDPRGHGGAGYDRGDRVGPD